MEWPQLSGEACVFFFYFDGTTVQGGPWPPLQYASKPLDPLFCLSIRLFPSFLGSWTHHPAISFLVFLFVFFGIAVCCILSVWPSHCILWHFINLTMFSPLIIASNSSFVEFSTICFLSPVHIFPAVFSFQILLMLFPLPQWVSTILNHR